MVEVPMPITKDGVAPGTDRQLRSPSSNVVFRAGKKGSDEANAVKTFAGLEDIDLANPTGQRAPQQGGHTTKTMTSTEDGRGNSLIAATSHSMVEVPMPITKDGVAPGTD